MMVTYIPKGGCNDAAACQELQQGVRDHSKVGRERCGFERDCKHDGRHLMQEPEINAIKVAQAPAVSAHVPQGTNTAQQRKRGRPLPTDFLCLIA
jgi:hypothetical protein